MKIGENWRLDVFGRTLPVDGLLKSPIMILLTAIASRYTDLVQTQPDSSNPGRQAAGGGYSGCLRLVSGPGEEVQDRVVHLTPFSESTFGQANAAMSLNALCLRSVCRHSLPLTSIAEMWFKRKCLTEGC
jgi:hypothetical protein